MNYSDIPDYSNIKLSEEVEEAFTEIHKDKEKKEQKNTFRFWFTIGIMIIGLVIAGLQVYQQYSMSNIKEQVQKNSDNIQKLSNDLNDLRHQVNKFDSTVAKISKTNQMLNKKK